MGLLTKNMEKNRKEKILLASQIIVLLFLLLLPFIYNVEKQNGYNACKEDWNILMKERTVPHFLNNDTMYCKGTGCPY